jgi:DNA transformation protein
MQEDIQAYKEYVLGDVLGHIKQVTSRAMFGGYGLYLDGTIFGIITGDGELRFKVNDSNRAQYEAYGSTPFEYTGHKNGKVTIMNYYLVPEEIQESREQVEEWARQSAALTKKK